MIVPNGIDNGSLDATSDVENAITGLLSETRSFSSDCVEIGLTGETVIPSDSKAK